MKQHEQCVEKWFAIRVGDWRDSQPYFLGAPTIMLFANQEKAKEHKKKEHIDNGKVVQVVVSTLGETMRRTNT